VNRLYRKTHETFEAYCKDRWEMGRSTAYQYIDSVKVVENVRNCGQTLPANERQTRPLVRLEPELQKEAWTKVVDRLLLKLKRICPPWRTFQPMKGKFVYHGRHYLGTIVPKLPAICPRASQSE